MNGVADFLNDPPPLPRIVVRANMDRPVLPRKVGDDRPAHSIHWWICIWVVKNPRHMRQVDKLPVLSQHPHPHRLRVCSRWGGPESNRRPGSDPVYFPLITPPHTPGDCPGTPGNGEMPC